jgi:hypothetical protein
MATESTQTTFPDKIRMRGLPPCFQGWNTVFTKAKDLDANGDPIYVLEDYTYLWFFPIIGCTIQKEDGRWVMRRDCDFWWKICKKNGLDQMSPFGDWSMGSVTANTKYFYWF